MIDKTKITRREALKTAMITTAGLATAKDISVAQAQAHDKPNLLFILSDQHRRQSQGYMHEDPVCTPCLDQMAQESAWFDNAVACSPICTPNRGCLMTGRYPSVTGVENNDDQLSTTIPTLGRVLKDAGYQTAYIGKWHLEGEPGGHHYDPTPIERIQAFGFDFWYMPFEHRHFDLTYQKVENGTEEEVHLGMASQEPHGHTQEEFWSLNHDTDTAIEWITKSAQKDAPFAMVLSWEPPHDGWGPGFFHTHSINNPEQKGVGYAAPKRFEDMYQNREDFLKRPNVKQHPIGDLRDMVPGYYGAITSLDENLGRLLHTLDTLNISNDTLVVYSSDHGEMAGSFGLPGKGIWYEESIGVPLLIRWPGKIQPGKRSAPFNSIDIMPMLLELMDIPVPDGVNGGLYRQYVRTGNGDHPEGVFLTQDKYIRDQPINRQWRGWRTESHMYVMVGSYQQHEWKWVTDRGGELLFDLRADTYQQRPVFGDNCTDEERVLMDNMQNEIQHVCKTNNDTFFEKYWQAG